MEEKKKRNVLLVIAIVTVLLTIIGAAYAYYTASIGDATTRDVEARTGTTDSLTFKAEDEININASILNFGEGQTSLRDDAKAIATLIAGTDSIPSMNYYVYLQIENNEFTYTTEGMTPELLLKVTGPDGEVTSISGLNYVTTTVDGVQESGFDITEQKGFILIANSYNITTSNTKIDEWTVEVVYVNLTSNQNDHLNKNLNAKITISKNIPLANYVVAQYTTDGVNNLYYHDGKGEYTNANLEARDNSYRYVGASSVVNNYVCLGSSAATCPTNNLYRIIGIFPTDETAMEYEAKLIKNTLLGKYPWHNNDTIIWKNSTLRTNVLNNMNGAYWQSLGTDANKIVSHNWVVSGGTWVKLFSSNAKTVYDYEVAEKCGTCTDKAKWETLSDYVGLMYISDYMYAANPTYWSSSSNSYGSAKSSDWLHISNSGTDFPDWTISRDIGGGVAFNVATSGVIEYSSLVWSDGVRPTIYLKSDTELVSGTGTSLDPYRLN